MNKNAVLLIKNKDGFEDDIWQTSGDNFELNEWKTAINNFADNAQSIYDWIDNLENKGLITVGSEFELYVLGDLINMLRSINVEIEGEPCDKCVYSTKDGYCQYDDITETIPPLEPCEDTISRQAVLDQTYLWSKDEFLRVTNPFDYLRKRINSLPSATGKRDKE